MSPRPAQSPEQTEAKRHAIIRATLDVIVARGPEAVRLSDVATAVGMSVGTVQYYFGSREVLLTQALSVHTATVLTGIEEMSQARDAGCSSTAQHSSTTRHSSSARHRLHESFAAVPGVGAHDQRSRIWVELVTAARNDEGLRSCVDAVFAGWRRHFRTIIDEGVERGEFELAGLSAREVVDTIIAIIDGFDLAAVAGHAPSPETMTRILTETADRLVEV